jgi:glycosyltransferase involved in cell wall biosynthesis
MIGEYPPMSGGIATHVKEIADALSEKNRIVVITPHQRSFTESLGSIEVHRVRRLRRRRFTMVTTILSLTIAANSLRRRVDLFHSHGFPCSGVGLTNKGCILVLTVHGYASLEMITSGRLAADSIALKAMKKFERSVVKRADAIVAVDSTIENWLKEDLNAGEDKVYCIPNGVNTQQFSPNVNGRKIRARYRVKDDEQLIVTIRKFTPKNGVETIIEGFKLLKKRYGFENVRLLLAGGGELKEKFSKMIKESGLEKCVTLEDAVPHEEVPKYFSAADIIANSFTHISGVKEFETSSLFEALEKARPIGTSITTLEALASGKPTVVSTTGGKFRGVSQNDVGVLTPDNSEILADALAKLLSRRNLLETIGKSGREYVTSKRTWKAIAERVSDVYRFAISKR